MNKCSVACALMLLIGSSSALAQSPEVLYKNSCASCHGRLGEKTALGKARPLTELTQQQIVEGLKARKAGEIVGAGNKVKARLSDDDIVALSEYVACLSSNDSGCSAKGSDKKH